jgi:hypothetical protein
MCAVKSLLLDVDGVLLRCPVLLEHVKYNCIKYVESKLPTSKNPRGVNRILYMEHGHTARGLQNAFRIDVSDFNEKVYDKKLIEHLSEVIYESQFQEEAKEIYEFTKKGWDVTLFTNAPVAWGGRVARAIGDEVRLRCPGDNLMNSPIKPEALAYDGFSKVQSHVFVDDCLKNLKTARTLPNWHPIHFSSDDNPWCPNIGSMWELGLFLDTADFLMERHETQ